MAKRRKKYNPQKEIGKLTGLTTGTLLGTHITYSVASQVPGGSAMVASPLRLMSKIPVVGAGGSVLRSLEMLNVKPKRKKRRK